MEKLELQIISGLHIGARHVLTKGQLILGGDEGADLRLLDDAFESVLLTLTRVESGAYQIQSDDEFSVVSAEGRRLSRSAHLQPGLFLNVGDVWFALQPAGAPLAEIPALLEESIAPGETLAQALDATAGHDDDVIEAGAAERKAVSVQRSLRRKAAAGFVGGVLAILVVGLGFAWVPSEAHSSRSDSEAAKPVAVQAEPKTDIPREQIVRDTVTELLRQRELETIVSFRVGFGEIGFNGTLNHQQVGSFDEVMAQLETQFGREFRISAQIERQQITPEFRIREVVMGKDGWIVTTTGKRIIIGGEIEGYRLAAIEANKVILVGPDRIEIQL